MKKFAFLDIVFNVIAIVLFVVGIILLSPKINATLGYVCISFGFVFLGLGIYLSRKNRNDKDKK